MESYTPNNTRHSIIHHLAEWCAFSATRSGCPVKSREKIYPLIQMPAYETVLTGTESIEPNEFNKWHKHQCIAITKQKVINLGWAAKLINCYLKVMTYTGGIGRPNLSACLHPPIDNILIHQLREKFKNDPELLKKLEAFTWIKNINSYTEYETIIDAIQACCNKAGWTLIESEIVWQGTTIES